MDIQKKQAKWNQERPLFEAELVHSYWLQFFNFNNNTGDYELKESLQNDEDAKLAFEVVNTGWVMWLRAKAQKVAVPTPTNEVICAIEREVENQLMASGINEDPFRLDGEKIYKAMIEAQEQA